MNNFDLLLAVLSGLNNVSVLRLKTLIWKKMPSKYRELFRNLEATMSATNGMNTLHEDIFFLFLIPERWFLIFFFFVVVYPQGF